MVSNRSLDIVGCMEAVDKFLTWFQNFVDAVSDVRVARCVVYVTEPSWTLTATSSGARVARLENVWGEVFDVHTVVNVPGLGLALHARRVS